MKTISRHIVLPFILAATAAFGATPPIDVTVADAAGKVAFKGKTSANGTFSTGKLQPGNYVVQFNSGNVKGNYAIVVSAGKKKVSADAVAGEKFARGGVAMKVDVGAGLNITGQVAQAASVAGDPNAKVKVMNGKRYVWIGPETGSNMSGRWVEEGSVDARNVSKVRSDDVRAMQDRGTQGAIPGQ